MRRFVRDRIAFALERSRATFEEFISRHLEYPLGFPYRLNPAAVVIRELRQIKVTPMAKADLPPVQVEVLVKVWLATRAVRFVLTGDWEPGVVDASVKVTARGTVNPDGTYTVEPLSAGLTAWWRDVVIMESQRLGPTSSS